MAVFFIAQPEPDQRLDKAVQASFGDPKSYYKIAPGQYLISAERKTTGEVCETLGIYGGNVGRALVVRLTNFTGWHAKDMLEWIDSQRSPPRAADPTEVTDE